MKIFLLTPIYATTTEGSGVTPVVHYFAKEWVNQGHEVFVFKLSAKFPSLYYRVARMFQHQLNTRLGMLVPTEMPRESCEVKEGVNVRSVCLKKVLPHSEYSHSQIEHAVDVIREGCDKYGVPDIFIGHWDNPQLNVLVRLKELYGRPTALVLHNNEFNYESIYGPKVVDMLKRIDFIGFRSLIGKKNFEAKYFVPQHSFIASSGVSDSFIRAGKDFSPSFGNGVHNFVFVGSLISRKYPCEILKALSAVYEDKDFRVTFIGDGNERKSIESFARENGLESNVVFTGRIRRDETIAHLKQSEVFVMISSGEIFGLVYLEAMALGLIPIGSRDEGIDGIISNDQNGFLCKAGDVEGLADVLRQLREMPVDKLEEMSLHAKETARDYTDSAVACRYINELKG